MPIRSKQYYVCNCDNCGYPLYSYSVPTFLTPENAMLSAIRQGWDVSDDTMHDTVVLCPDCCEGVE